MKPFADWPYKPKISGNYIFLLPNPHADAILHCLKVQFGRNGFLLDVLT